MMALDSDVRELRGFQVDAVADIAAGLRSDGRGQIHAACGTGKTLIALRVAEKVVPKSGTVVILAPSIGLVAQSLEAWIRDAKVPFAESAVCSDDTVTDAARSDQVSTDPEVIAKWLHQRGRKVIAGTYASAPALAEAAREAGASIDLLVCDEAHRLAGRPDKAAAVVLAEDKFPARRRLFLTATPRLCYEPDAPGLTMDDEALFGPVLCDYPFSAAIADGWLDDYRVAVIGVTDEEIRALLGDDGETEYVDGRSNLPLTVLAAQVALATAAREHGIRRAVTFHSRVAAAAEFARTINATVSRLPAGRRPAGTCAAFSVSGMMTSDQREGILDNLRTPPAGGWSVVANARCLGEGIDIPAIDAVLFASPRDSVTDIAQAAGRALRRHEGGTGTATIIIPVVVSSSGDISDLDSGAYETVWRVVSAMREHDEALATGLDFARAHWARDYEHTTRSEPELPSRVSVIIPGDIGDRMANALSLAIIQHASSAWWDGYGRAATFYEDHQHLSVPVTYACTDGFTLGRWIDHARQFRRKGMLPPDRAEALEKLHMIWDAPEARWEAAFLDAVAYRETNGSLDVPKDYVTPDGVQLGWWLKTQRTRNTRGLLSAERRDRLAVLGMVWDKRKPRRDQLMEAARAYRAEHGDLEVPQRYVTPEGHRLGQWMNKRRTEHRKGIINPEVARELDALGMRWVVRESLARRGPRKRSSATTAA